MLPHPSMSFAWEEGVVRPTRMLVAMLLLALIVVAGASGLVEFTIRDHQAAIAAQRERHPPIAAIAP